MKKYTPPGIFNDAIGPVMRGPSSSHTAGSHRIGAVLKQMAQGPIEKVIFRFHKEGSLATTYQTQGSDIGLAAGLMGMDITDPQMPNAMKLVRETGIEIIFIIEDYPATHPNTYECEVHTKAGDSFQATALSTGGGLIEFVQYEGFEISNPMDLPCLFVIGNVINLMAIQKRIESEPTTRNIIHSKDLQTRDDVSFLSIVFKEKLDTPEITGISSVRSCLIHPVYPVLGYTGSKLPFQIASDIEADKKLHDRELWELAVDYETNRSNIGKDQVMSNMQSMLEIFREAIRIGLGGTSYDDRILGSQSPGFYSSLLNGRLLPSGPLARMTAYTMAIMEAKSAMQVIIAAPTAGSAGGLPGTLIGMGDELKSTDEEMVKAFLAAGLIGVFISRQATFAAEVAGCQAETGAGAAMAAAGLIQLAGGNAIQAMGAASIALQNIMGLVCDPVGNRVEVPCLGRNVQEGSNALACANMILGGVDPVIPLSESIVTMLEVGNSMPRELRCTALGGLAATPTAKRIEERLKK